MTPVLDWALPAALLMLALASGGGGIAGALAGSGTTSTAMAVLGLSTIGGIIARAVLHARSSANWRTFWRDLPLVPLRDALLMLQYATYSVISPEGCASILWKSAERAPEAAESLGITAARLKALGLVDKVVPEPNGGAHRDPAAMASSLKRVLTDTLKPLMAMPVDDLLAARRDRLLSFGKFKEIAPD